MKKHLLTVLLLAIAPLWALALNPSAKVSLYDHLKDVNAQWEKIEPTAAQLLPVSFENDTRRIQAHLFNTEQYLRSQLVAHLSAELQQKRAHLLDVLNGYAEAAVFPQNYDFSYRIPYFIDAHNTACAVGYLIIADGHKALAEMILNNNNYQYLLDMQYPELSTWVAGSGFTAQELALIQPGYLATTPFSFVAGNSGTNGHVNDVVTVNGAIYIAGDFTGVGGTTGFGNIAYLDGGTWADLDGGLDGEVYAMAVYNDELYVGGNFMGSESGVGSEGLIKWNGTEWEAVNTLGIYGDVFALQVFNNKLYVGGDFEFPTGALRGFLMAVDDTIGEILPDFPMGPVHSLAVHDGELIFGGEFTTTFNGVVLSNVAKLDNLGNVVAIGNGVNTTVLALASYQDDLYIGGRFFDNNGDTVMGLAYWNDTTWVDESTLVRGIASNNYVIHDFLVNDDYLYVGGKFSCCDGVIAYYGSNLAKYYRSGGYGGMQGVTTFDDAVYSINLYNSELIVGGVFDTAIFGSGVGGNPNQVANLGGLALKNDNWNSVIDLNAANISIGVYPVPASSKVTFKIDGEVLTRQPVITIYNTLGQQVDAATLTAAHTEVDISKLQSGVYLYHLNTVMGNVATGRFVVEQ